MPITERTPGRPGLVDPLPPLAEVAAALRSPDPSVSRAMRLAMSRHYLPALRITAVRRLRSCPQFADEAVSRAMEHGLSRLAQEPAPEGPSALRFLARYTINFSLKIRLREQRREARELAAEQIQEPRIDDPETLVVEKKRIEAVHRCIGRLPEQQREVMKRSLRGDENVAIAKALGLKPGTVGATLAAARKNLKPCLEKERVNG